MYTQFHCNTMCHPTVNMDCDTSAAARDDPSRAKCEYNMYLIRDWYTLLSLPCCLPPLYAWLYVYFMHVCTQYSTFRLNTVIDCTLCISSSYPSRDTPARGRIVDSVSCNEFSSGGGGTPTSAVRTHAGFICVVGSEITFNSLIED